jgi:REP element-mobilizing transposase RayT
LRGASSGAYTQQPFVLEGAMRILAAHIIFTAYGFWLPNDPRGSWSEFVASWELLKYGKATKVDTRDSVAHVKHDSNKRRAAKKSLKYAPVLFNGLQARAVASGFSRAAHESGYTVHACSVLPDHVHLVIGNNNRSFEQITAHLKARASQQLRAEGLHPFIDHPLANGSLPSVWAEGLWKVYCYDVDHVGNAIRYVEKNPLRENKRQQHWSFVRPFVE